MFIYFLKNNAYESNSTKLDKLCQPNHVKSVHCFAGSNVNFKLKQLFNYFIFIYKVDFIRFLKYEARGYTVTFQPPCLTNEK